ncbi:ABC transporter ATP-binding protein [Pantoea sp. FN060301]|uniref:ABC transporter ATP-binding protein n=1 Tax=Pantoea sp. FN060301 TaxID=3420380 RepID=UPI003D186E3E
MPGLLKVEGVSLLSRRKEWVLDNITFSLAEGERVAILGPNGSGKSTLLRTITGECAPDKGILHLRGRPVLSLKAGQRAREIAFLSQNDVPDPRLTLEEYVALGRLPHVGKSSRETDRQIVKEALDDTGLHIQRHRPLGELSGGQQQRAALARALAQTPSLLLLDEPTNHLDPPGRSALLALIKSKGIAVVAVLHDLPLAESFADRILVLREGRQVICDVPEKVLQTPVLFPVFGLESFCVSHPASGKNMRIFDLPHSA